MTISTFFERAVAAPPGLALVQTDEAFAIAQTGGVDDDAPSALASVVAYRRADNSYGPAAGQPQMRVYDAAVPRDGGGDPAGPAALAAGQRGWAAFNAQSGRWELVLRDACGAAETTCITVITGVSKVGGDLIFTVKQVCLPACVTIANLSDISIACCDAPES